MSYRLRVEEVRSSSRLRTSLSPGEASDHGEYSDGVLEVEDEGLAVELVGNHGNVEWLEAEESQGSGAGPSRAVASNDGVEFVDEEEEGVETCDVVKNDGEVCGRELPCPYHS